jgi:DNA-binding response OmpR family regulator
VPGTVDGNRHADRATILIVALDHGLRMLYRFNLEAQGLRVIEAEDGFTGLELARAERPDLILLDVMMQGLNGWQLADVLRKDRATREIPFLFVTARVAPDDRVHGLALGAVDYIPLPCNPVVLGAHVRQLVEDAAE